MTRDRGWGLSLMHTLLVAEDRFPGDRTFRFEGCRLLDGREGSRNGAVPRSGAENFLRFVEEGGVCVIAEDLEKEEGGFSDGTSLSPDSRDLSDL